MGICYQTESSINNYSTISKPESNLGSFVIANDADIPPEFVFSLKGFSTCEMILRQSHNPTFDATQHLIINAHLQEIKTYIPKIMAMEKISSCIIVQIVKIQFKNSSGIGENVSIHFKEEQQVVDGWFRDGCWYPHEKKGRKFIINELDRIIVSIKMNEYHSLIRIQNDSNPLANMKVCAFHSGKVEPVGYVYFRCEYIANFQEHRQRVKTFLQLRRNSLQRIVNKHELEDSVQYDDNGSSFQSHD